MRNFQEQREVIINMIDKNIKYNDKDFLNHLKGLGLSQKEIENILGETKRKKFDDGGDGGSGGDGSSGDGSSGDGDSSGDSSGDGDSSGEGDSGPGGSDDGTGHGGPGPGPGGAEGGFGIGPDAATEAAQSAAQSISADDVSAQAQADQEDAATAAAAAANTGIASTLGNMARAAFNAYSRFSPTGIAINAISTAIGNAQRGVTGPSDDTQEQSSVQSSAPSTPDGGGGITTVVPDRYELYNNITTGDPVMDALIARYRIDPSAFGIR